MYDDGVSAAREAPQSIETVPLVSFIKRVQVCGAAGELCVQILFDGGAAANANQSTFLTSKWVRDVTCSPQVLITLSYEAISMIDLMIRNRSRRSYS